VSLFGWFKSAPKVVDNVFDKDRGLLTQVGSWIGNSKFTDEERAELNAENIKAVQGFVVATLAENTDRSVARREIAVFFIKFYAILIFMAGITHPINPEWSLVWFNLATSLSVGGLVTAISVFFFGSHAISRHTESKNLKKGS
jgi:hypothetical protein